jgi:hypothetical protein
VKGALLGGVALAEALNVSQILFAIVTGNEWANGMALLVPALGILHATLRVWGDPAAPGADAVLIRRVLVTAAIADALGFAYFVDWNREVHDLRGSPPGLAVVNAPGLGFMRYRVAPHYGIAADDLAQAIRFLRERDLPFLVVGDNAILYGLLRKPSAASSLWFHAGLTLPGAEDPFFAAYRERTLAGLRRHRVELVVEEAHGPMKFQELFTALFDGQPRVRLTSVARFGAIRVHRLEWTGAE